MLKRMYKTNAKSKTNKKPVLNLRVITLQT